MRYCLSVFILDWTMWGLVFDSICSLRICRLKKVSSDLLLLHLQRGVCGYLLFQKLVENLSFIFATVAGISYANAASDGVFIVWALIICLSLGLRETAVVCETALIYGWINCLWFLISFIFFMEIVIINNY